MKKKIKIALLTAFTSVTLISCLEDDDNQQMDQLHYFRFSSCPEQTHGHWQDTSFVAATADTAVIKQCLEQLKLPLNERTLFPLGKLASGSADYNKNGSHDFNWHFIENDWEMVEIGIEIYDGCAYTDAELEDYLNTVQRYGGWSNRVIEELEAK